MYNQVGVEDLATALNLKRRRVSQLVQQGILPPAQKGRYDVVECLKAYVTYSAAAWCAPGHVERR